MKNNSDCLFGPTIGQRHKSPSNGPSASYPVAFRAALGGFLVGCVELGMSGFSKWRAVKVSTSNSPKNQESLQKIKQKSKTRDSRTDGKVIVLLNRRNISSLFA